MMERRGLSWFVVVATAVTLEMVRSVGPLLDSVYASAGLNRTVLAAVVTFAGPGAVVAVVVPVLRVLPPRHAAFTVLVAPAVLLVALRTLAQAAPPDVRLPVTLGAVAVSIAVLVVAVGALASYDEQEAVAAAAVTGGLVAALLLQLLLGTWDAVWRHSVTAWVVSGLVDLALVATAVAAAGREADGPPGRAGRAWALGPFLALAVVITANAAFVASQAGVALLVAGAVAALGLVTAAALALRPVGHRQRAVAAGAAVALTVGVAALLRVPRAGGPALVVLACVVVVQVAATISLDAALAPSRQGPASSRPPVVGWRTAVAATLAGLTAGVPVLLYQIEYRAPLGYPNHVTLTAAALLLGLAGVRRAPSYRRATRRTRLVVGVAIAGVLATVAAAGGVRLTTPDRPLDTAAPTDPAAVRVLEWNMHYAVDGSGTLDPEVVAQTIERHRPDVVLLNEVTRGWIVGGGADLADWLHQRLGGYVAYAPAADRQFGNVLLSRWPLDDTQRVEVPQGDGTQARSMLSASVTTPLGDLTVVAVHLEDGAGRAAVREQQVPALLSGLAATGADALVFGGDLNSTPTSDEIAAITGAGYVSAVDEVGDPDATTQPSDDPDRRIDWIFGRGVRFLDADVLVDEQSSDHLPVLATFVP